MSIGPLVSEDGEHQVGLQHATTEGSAAKPQDQQTDLEIAQEYVKKADELAASKEAVRLVALKESAAKDPIVHRTDGNDAVTAGNTAAAEETGLGGGM